MRPAAVTLVVGLATAVLAWPATAQDLTIRRWLIRGPIAAPAGEGRVERDYLGGEAEVLPSVESEGWEAVETDAFGRLNLNDVFEGQPTEWSAAYAHTYVYAPEDRTLLLVADSDDDLDVRVNGQRVWLNEVARGLGLGSDTVAVRLSRGWNSLLLKPLNRGGGFGLLARLAAAEGAGVTGLQLSTSRPPGLTAHNHPQPTITVGPILFEAGLSWRAGELVADNRVPLVAWGAAAFSDVSIRLSQGGRALLQLKAGGLTPGEPREVDLELSFEDLRRASLGDASLIADASWARGARRAPVLVNADRVLRLLNGRVAIGDLVVDSVEGVARMLSARLIVPRAFNGLSLDLLTNGLGPSARYSVDGKAVRWRDGLVELCSPCRSGASIDLEIEPQPARPIWGLPQVRVRESGYVEYAEGFEYAEALAGRTPSVERPVPDAWLRAVGDRNASRALAARYRETFAPLSARIRRDTLHLVGNSHIDAAWLWPWSETIEVIRDTWRTSLKLAELFPGYIFAGSSAAYYDAMDRLEPGLADSLVAAARSGSWVPVGGWWVEADMNLPSGESLVRQGLYGQRYFQRRFGRRSKVAWTPDTFGYPWTVPQILRGQGFEFFVTQKIRWNDSTEFPHNAFYWQGRDGTRILGYNPYGYVHNLDPDRLVTERVEDRQRTGSNHQIVLYGVGDHGGGPTIAMLQRAEDLRRVPTFPALEYAEPEGALEAVRGSLESRALPVWDDELYLEYHRGTYTTHGQTKWRNRRSEAMLQTAEALATVGEAPYPGERLETAWRLILFNQFHDILPGSSIREVYQDARFFYDSAWAILDSLSAAGFTSLRGRMDTRGGGQAIVVFNPLGWRRNGNIKLPGKAGGEGDSVSVSVSEVPALGARVIRLPRDSMSSLDRMLPAPSAGPDWIENAYLRVEVDTLSGEIVRLLDRKNSREVLAPAGRGNVLQVFDDRPGQWDAWNIVLSGERWDVSSVTGASSGADARRAVIELERRWGNSRFRQRLILERGSPYLDVENEVDWHERRKLLKVAFALNVEADSATYEIPYGTIGRSGRPRTQAERAKFEVPGQRWADVSGAGYGVSILNDGKYGWDYKGNVLRLSLLRAPIWPDSLADRGYHRFRFAVYPHAGDWRSAGTVNRAAEYNVPLLASYERAHPGTLGRAVSFASVRPTNAQIAWLKRAEDTDAWVLRLVEWHGRAADAVVALDCQVERARRANLLEDPGAAVAVGGKTVMLSLRAYEIATLLVECKP